MTTKMSIFLTLLLFGIVAARPSDTDPDIDLDDYKHDERDYDVVGESTTTSNMGSTPNNETELVVHGYVIKTGGFLNLTVKTSEDGSLLLIRGIIGNAGVIRQEETVEEVLFEIIHSDEESVDEVNKIAKKQWLLIKPPGDVNVGVIHWERDGQNILITGPIPITDLGSSEATNATEIFPPIID